MAFQDRALKDRHAKIVDELRHRRDEAWRLSAEADAEWEEAKLRFEKQLLGE